MLLLPCIKLEWEPLFLMWVFQASIEILSLFFGGLGFCLHDVAHGGGYFQNICDQAGRDFFQESGLDGEEGGFSLAKLFRFLFSCFIMVFSVFFSCVISLFLSS